MQKKKNVCLVTICERRYGYEEKNLKQKEKHKKQNKANNYNN